MKLFFLGEFKVWQWLNGWGQESSGGVFAHLSGSWTATGFATGTMSQNYQTWPLAVTSQHGGLWESELFYWDGQGFRMNVPADMPFWLILRSCKASLSPYLLVKVVTGLSKFTGKGHRPTSSRGDTTVMLQKNMWDRRCCGHLWKIVSGTT